MSKEYWNSEAIRWRDSRSLGDLSGDVEKYIKGLVDKYLYVRRNGYILNLGSGSESSYLQSWCDDRVISLDYARKMLEARSLSNLVEADARYSLPLANESATGVCSFFLMRYLNREQQINLVEESSRVLQTGGSLLIVDIPNNGHLYQIEEFEPLDLLSALELSQMSPLTAGVHERRATRFVGTGFGGPSENEKYQIGIVVARKR